MQSVKVGDRIKRHGVEEVYEVKYVDCWGFITKEDGTSAWSLTLIELRCNLAIGGAEVL